MFFRRLLRKLSAYFRYYIWMFYLRRLHYPTRRVFGPCVRRLRRWVSMLAPRILLRLFYTRIIRRSFWWARRHMYRPTRKVYRWCRWRWRRFDWRHIQPRKLRFKRAVSALFWLIVSYIEHSPARFWGVVRDVYWVTSRFILGLRVTRAFLNLARRFFRIYFMIVSFRRLLCIYLLLDHFVYRWSDLGIDRDLRMWNLCMLCAFFNVLYMLMDASDKRLTHKSHDFLTRAYFRYHLKIEPSKVLTKEQMADPRMARYINIRYRRNAALAIVGFFYTGQPLFRSYK